MRAMTIIYLVVVIAAFMSIFGSFKNDINAQYGTTPQEQINASKWENRFDFSPQINSSINSLKEKFDTITDTEQSWFTRIGAGIVAIPYAVVIFPLVIFDGFSNFGAILTGLSSDFYVENGLIAMILIYLTILGVQKLLEFFQRSPA